MSHLLDLKKPSAKQSDHEESRDASVATPSIQLVSPATVASRPLQIPRSVSWQGPSRQNFANHTALYAFSIGLYLLGAFLVYFQGSIITGSLFFLAPTMLLIHGKSKPKVVDFAVGPISAKAGKKEYKFSEIKSFWVEYNPGGIKELSLQPKKWYLPYVKMPIGDQDPVTLSAILLGFMPEEEHKDSPLDSFSRILGA